jgi:hypothetical protein
MSMFWLVYETPEGRCVVLQSASSAIHARLVSSLSGLDDASLVEAHQLDEKVPIGPLLKAIA